MSRRSPGAGSIDQLPSGRYRVRLPAVAGERKPVTFGSEQEAQDFLDASLHLMAEGDAVPSGELTLRTWGERWLDRREIDGVRNVRTDRSRWAQHIATAPFAEWVLSEIRTPQIGFDEETP